MIIIVFSATALPWEVELKEDLVALLIRTACVSQTLISTVSCSVVRFY